VTPYYAEGGVTVYHGDCLDVLAELPDASVDAVVTDPPYGLEFMGKEWDGGRIPPLTQRRSSSGASCGPPNASASSSPAATSSPSEAPAPGTASPAPSRTPGSRSATHRVAVRVRVPEVAGRVQGHRQGRQRRRLPVLLHREGPGSERVRIDGVAHPTVKPLDLMRWLVRLVTPPGGTVLEPFAGSGTTVEACILEGFRCIDRRDEPSRPPPLPGPVVLRRRLRTPRRRARGAQDEDPAGRQLRRRRAAGRGRLAQAHRAQGRRPLPAQAPRPRAHRQALRDPLRELQRGRRPRRVHAGWTASRAPKHDGST
jgi:hypothetical protein